MVRQITTAFSLLLSLAATIPAEAQKRGHASSTAAKPTLKFLDAIEVAAVDGLLKPISTGTLSGSASPEPLLITTTSESETITPDAIETASALQLKYAVLLNTEVEQIQNRDLFSAIDEWYGTRYVLGGTSKNGIDCSAFVQAIYAKLFQIPMPRTAKEQYSAVQQIPHTELKQGDLVFFNTRGGSVSHVGIYLQNNKFVHAATSGGVMVSDLSEEYWMKHFTGAGRSEKESPTQSLTLKP